MVLCLAYIHVVSAKLDARVKQCDSDVSGGRGLQKMMREEESCDRVLSVGRGSGWLGTELAGWIHGDGL